MQLGIGIGVDRLRRGGVAAAPIEFIGAVIHEANSGALPAGAQEGDLAIVLAGEPDETTTPPAGWTLFRSQSVTNTATLHMRLVRRFLQPGDVNTGVWTGSHTSLYVAVYRNVNPDNPIGSISSSGSAAFAVTVPGIVMLGANSWGAWAGYARTGVTGVGVTSAGFTSRASSVTGNFRGGGRLSDSAAVIADKSAVSMGTYGGGWGGILYELRGIE